MTDETFVRITEFVKRNAVPATKYMRELPVPVYVSDDVPDDEPELSEEPYALGIRLSPADHEDLRRRLMLGGTEMRGSIDGEGDETLRPKD